MKRLGLHRTALTALTSAAAGTGIATYWIKRQLLADVRTMVDRSVCSSQGDPIDGGGGGEPSAEQQVPAATPIDFPLSRAVGEAALSVQDDGTWSVNVTVIPTDMATNTADPATTLVTPMACDLSPAVALMHSAIIRAARAKDHKVLEELAFGVSDEFTYSFQEPVLRGRPARYWKKLEAEGQQVLDALVDVLELPYARMEHMYIWPADMDWLGGSTTRIEPKQVEGNGYRVGIATTGDWLFFVSDD